MDYITHIKEQRELLKYTVRIIDSMLLHIRAIENRHKAEIQAMEVQVDTPTDDDMDVDM